MSTRIWRTLAVVLALACGFFYCKNRSLRAQRDNGAKPAAQKRAQSMAARLLQSGPASTKDSLDGVLRAETLDEKRTPTWRMQGALARFFMPDKGESPTEYRDRIVPIALMFIEPQRQRVDRVREQFEKRAGIDARQRDEIDALVSDTGDKIMTRALQAALSGEIRPPRIKLTTAVGVAHDILDIGHQTTQAFHDVLSREQRETLEQSDFDMLEYIVFASPWEGMLGYSK